MGLRLENAISKPLTIFSYFIAFARTKKINGKRGIYGMIPDIKKQNYQAESVVGFFHTEART